MYISPKQYFLKYNIKEGKFYRLVIQNDIKSFNEGSSSRLYIEEELDDIFLQPNASKIPNRIILKDSLIFEKIFKNHFKQLYDIFIEVNGFENNDFFKKRFAEKIGLMLLEDLVWCLTFPTSNLTRYKMKYLII